MKVLLKEIKMTPRGKQLIISRSDNDFLVGLFKLEVPEISSETVVIKSIAREPGSRSKVAVFSKTEGIDPIGACVGQKGVRINAVLNDLKFGMFEEKIDIILWNEEPTQFIANALSPATVNEVEITNADEKRVRVWVADDQLSLAIGKEGQNVRLAAKLTGWNIDIMGESQKAELRKAEKAKTKAVKAEKAEVKAEAKPKKAAAKKVTVKKAVKKAPAKKTVAAKAPAKKKAVIKKPAAKKAAVKKVVAKKTPVKKAVAKKPAAKKTVKKTAKK
jgi:N utilization substance protein A